MVGLLKHIGCFRIHKLEKKCSYDGQNARKNFLVLIILLSQNLVPCFSSLHLLKHQRTGAGEMKPYFNSYEVQNENAGMGFGCTTPLWMLWQY